MQRNDSVMNELIDENNDLRYSFVDQLDRYLTSRAEISTSASGSVTIALTLTSTWFRDTNLTFFKVSYIHQLIIALLDKSKPVWRISELDLLLKNAIEENRKKEKMFSRHIHYDSEMNHSELERCLLRMRDELNEFIQSKKASGHSYGSTSNRQP